MAVRKRFKPTEKLVFIVGARVEWLNGSHWQPGVIVAGIELDSIGISRVMVRNEATTRTVSRGELISVSPGQVRLTPNRERLPGVATYPSTSPR